MPSIRSVGTALPDIRYSLDEVSQIGSSWLHDQPQKQQLFDRFLYSSRTEARHFVVPSEVMLGLNGMQHRSELFEEHGPHLGERAMLDAFTRADRSAADIETLLFTSCSCPTIPAIDALIIDRVGLARTIPRIPIYQHGCAGGVVGLGLAADLARIKGTVALTSVELCSLVFQPKNPTAAQLVGSAIFADGAACALLTNEDRGLVIRGSQSFLIPETRHLMGYNVLDDGFHLRLDRELPQALSEIAPERVRSFLKEHGTTPESIAFWLFHPGGTKILDYLERTFALRPEQAHWSRDILKSVGNLSSATVLFVLRAFLDSNVYKPGDKVVMLGVGPGLTIELILFEWVG